MFKSVYGRQVYKYVTSEGNVNVWIQQNQKKRAYVFVSPIQVETEGADLTESSDERIYFEKPKPWTAVAWLNHDNEAIELNIKGKAKTFNRLSAKITVSRRMKVISVNGT